MDLIIENGILMKAIVEEADAHVVIPEGCTEIGDKAFYRNENITKVTLPSSLRKIGDEAFYYCCNLREINLESVEEIGDTAFCGNDRLRSVSLGPITILPRCSFMCCDDLESVTFPDTLREIGEYAFNGCKKLTSLDLKNTEILRESAFGDCDGLKELHIPCVIEMDIWTFYDSWGVLDIVNDWLEKNAWRREAIELTIHKNKSDSICLGGNTDPFDRMDNPEQIVAVNSETASEDFRFDGDELYLPGKLLGYTIDAIAVHGVCTNVPYRILHIPEGVRSIYGWTPGPVFRPEVEIIYIPSSVNWIGSNPFFNCEKLHTLMFSPDDPIFELVDGVLYNKYAELVAVLPGCFHKDTLTIREGTKFIHEYAISNLPELKQVIVPEGCSYGYYIKFYNCPNLEIVRVPRKFKDNGTGEWWFRDCPKAAVYVEKKDIELIIENGILTKVIVEEEHEHVIIPAGCTEIADNVFSGNENITKVTLPSSLKTINGNPFRHCKNLHTIVIAPENPHFDFEDGALYQKEKLIAVLPACFHKETLIIRESTRWIGDCAISNLPELKQLIVPEGCSSDNYIKFYNCPNLEVRVPKAAVYVEEKDIELIITDGILTGAIVGEENAHVVIPEGCTEIADRVFERNKKVIKVTLPSSLRKIGDEAFYHCSNLREINLEFVEEIGEYAFGYNRGLVNVTLGPITILPKSTFSSCSNLESAVFSDTLREIGEGAFANCEKMTGIDLKNTVKIGDRAFDSCYNLQEINLESVEEIGEGAFGNNRGLVHVTLGPITILPKGSFKGCDNLETVVFPDTVREIGEGAFENCKKLTGIDLKNTVKIGDRAFNSCYSLQEINLELVEEIGEGAFGNNRGLVHVTFGSLTVLQNGNFKGCDNLEAVVLPDTLREIGESVFRFCKKLTSIDLKNIVKIGHYAFSYCPNLESVVFSDTVREIGEWAFAHCEKLTSIDLKNTFKIGCHAFDDCSDLQEVVMHHVREFGDTREMPFNKCPNISVDVYELWNKYKWPWPKNPVDVCYYFDKDGWLCLGKASDEFDRKGSAVIERGEEDILSLPGKIAGYPVKSIGQHGLDLSVPYRTLHIPEGVRQIIGGAEGPVFRPEVEIIHIPTSLNKIVNPFINCENLHTLRISPYNQRFELVDGVLYDKKDAALVAVLPGVFHNDTLVVREGTRSIGRYAIANLPELKQVIVPEEVAYEAEECFYNCLNLEAVNVAKDINTMQLIIEDGILTKAIVEEADSYVVIPEGCTEIAGEAFCGNENITKAYLPSSLKAINGNPFRCCANLHTIEIAPDNTCFDFEDGVLYQKEKLVAVLPGSFHKEMLIVREGTRSIGNGAIADLPDLKLIIMPEEVEYEAEKCIYNCPNLETVIVSKAAVHFGK